MCNNSRTHGKEATHGRTVLKTDRKIAGDLRHTWLTESSLAMTLSRTSGLTSLSNWRKIGTRCSITSCALIEGELKGLENEDTKTELRSDERTHLFHQHKRHTHNRRAECSSCVLI